MVPPSSVRITRVPTYLICKQSIFMYGAITRYRSTFQKIPLILCLSAAPLSLAATQGISVDFFSSGYLDVSVLRVSFLSDSPKTGFPHSEIAGSKLVCQLPRAYRRLQRPSSPLIAKASTVCTSVLDHTILELTKRPFMHGTDYTINADL